MSRHVFYSLHYDADRTRAELIRGLAGLVPNLEAKPSDWATLSRSGEFAIKRWFEQQVRGRSCTIVLIGAATESRPWVRYEAERSWALKLGLLGVHIHNLKDAKGQQATKGQPVRATARAARSGLRSPQDRQQARLSLHRRQPREVGRQRGRGAARASLTSPASAARSREASQSARPGNRARLRNAVETLTSRSRICRHLYGISAPAAGRDCPAPADRAKRRSCAPGRGARRKVESRKIWAWLCDFISPGCLSLLGAGCAVDSPTSGESPRVLAQTSDTAAVPTLSGGQSHGDDAPPATGACSRTTRVQRIDIAMTPETHWMVIDDLSARLSSRTPVAACTGLAASAPCSFLDVSGTCVNSGRTLTCRATDQSRGRLRARRSHHGAGDGALRRPRVAPRGHALQGKLVAVSRVSQRPGQAPMRLDFDEYEDEHPEVKNQRFSASTS